MGAAAKRLFLLGSSGSTKRRAFLQPSGLVYGMLCRGSVLPSRRSLDALFFRAWEGSSPLKPHFPVSFPTNVTARSIQSLTGRRPRPSPARPAPSSSSALPVMSNALTCGSSSASSPWSGPSRAMSESFQTPTSMLPFRRKPTQPNIFFSSTPFLRARASRMRGRGIHQRPCYDLSLATPPWVRRYPRRPHDRIGS